MTYVCGFTFILEKKKIFTSPFLISRGHDVYIHRSMWCKKMHFWKGICWHFVRMSSRVIHMRERCVCVYKMQIAQKKSRLKNMMGGHHHHHHHLRLILYRRLWLPIARNNKRKIDSLLACCSAQRQQYIINYDEMFAQRFSFVCSWGMLHATK